MFIVTVVFFLLPCSLLVTARRRYTRNTVETLIFSVSRSFVLSSWKSQRLDSSEIHAHSVSRTRLTKSSDSSECRRILPLAANSIGAFEPGRGKVGFVALCRSKFLRSSSSASSREFALPDIPVQLITLAVQLTDFRWDSCVGSATGRYHTCIG